MLDLVKNLPGNVIGIRAIGTVTKRDYDGTLKPALEAAQAAHARVRLLYHFPPEFNGLTTWAGFEDAHLGLKHLRLFERCAVVSDVHWIQEAARLLRAVMPCPVRIFEDSEWKQAVAWTSAPVESAVRQEMLPTGVLVVEPHGRLQSEDVDALTTTVDPWIESRGQLRGIVVHSHGLPGWHDLGSFLEHMRFIREHHRHVDRVALAADGAAAGLIPTLTGPFVQAQLRRFDYDRFDDAVAWAGEAPDAEP